MGCGKSKAAAPQKGKTLLDSPEQKDKVTPSVFGIFLDGPIAPETLVATDDKTSLKVAQVQGGAVGLWNNRARTEKVQLDDLVTKLRKAGTEAGEWLSDATAMLEAVKEAAVFEVEIKRPVVEEPKVEAKAEEATKEEAKTEEAKTEEAKAEEAKTEEAAPATEEAKTTEAQPEEAKPEEAKAEEAAPAAEAKEEQKQEAATEADIVTDEVEATQTKGCAWC